METVYLAGLQRPAVVASEAGKTGPGQTKQASQPSQPAVSCLYTTNIQSLYGIYTGLRMPDFGQNHENWSESGPYGSVWDDTPPESIPRGLGSLWDTSRTLKPP